MFSLLNSKSDQQADFVIVGQGQMVYLRSWRKFTVSDTAMSLKAMIPTSDCGSNIRYQNLSSSPT